MGGKQSIISKLDPKSDFEPMDADREDQAMITPSPPSPDGQTLIQEQTKDLARAVAEAK